MANPNTYYHGHKWQITELGLLPAPPKLGRSRNVLAIGGQCTDSCKVFPKGLAWSKGKQTYDEYNYCKRCRVYIPKKDLAATKQGAKILCPCCRSFTRRKKARRPNR